MCWLPILPGKKEYRQVVRVLASYIAGEEGIWEAGRKVDVGVRRVIARCCCYIFHFYSVA